MTGAREFQRAIVEERERVKSELAEHGPLLEAGAAVIEAALDLLNDPQELYRQTSDPVRRQLNDVFFERLYLDAEDVIDDRPAEPFSDYLHSRSLNRRRMVQTDGHRMGKTAPTWTLPEEQVPVPPCSNASHMAKWHR
jgi:site-specific DNA recombinase